MGWERARLGPHLLQKICSPHPPPPHLARVSTPRHARSHVCGQPGFGSHLWHHAFCARARDLTHTDTHTAKRSLFASQSAAARLLSAACSPSSACSHRFYPVLSVTTRRHTAARALAIMSRVASTNVFEALTKRKPSKEEDAPPPPPPRHGKLSTASSRLNVGDWADSDDAEDGFHHPTPAWADVVRGGERGGEERSLSQRRPNA